MQICGSCTLCCKLLNIIEVNSKSGKYCQYCNPNVGCNIYFKHPQSCKTFNCVWMQMKKVHMDLRPDKCHVVFEKINNSLIVGSIDGKISEMSNLIKRQIKSFNSEGYSVFMQQFVPYKFICYHIKGANKEEIIKALKDKSNDSTKLY